MSTLLERLGVERRVVQAGMGGGAAGHALAAAVSEAGGLGTIGFTAPDRLAAELRAARERTERPLAVNLLPFARRRHWEAARSADLVVTFFSRPVRRTDRPWVHQCGSVEEALAAREAGADGVIVQGVEAGGHVRGTEPALQLLGRARAALPAGYPVLVAGGVATRADVEQVVAGGADAAVLGTRFLMSRESPAHPGYKERVRTAGETLLTELFSLGWPAPHRVVPNAATRRWTRRDPRGPGWVRGLNRLTAPVAARMQADLASFPAKAQRPGLPMFSPLLATEDAPERLLECTPLYAGETALRIGDVRPAGELVRELSP